METESPLLDTNVTVKRALEGVEEQGTASVHCLPCRIEYDGDAAVEDYFLPRHLQNEMQGTFRGRLLRGESLELASGIAGIVLKQTHPRRTKFCDQQNFATVKGLFKGFTYWNHDKATSKNDYLHRSMDWLDTAAALHAPLEPEAP